MYLLLFIIEIRTPLGGVLQRVSEWKKFTTYEEAKEEDDRLRSLSQGMVESDRVSHLIESIIFPVQGMIK